MGDIAAAANRLSTATTTPARDKLDQPENARGGALTADFDTFLRLLTTQLQSQDPLAPIESTEFVAQLAQFSAVEQQVQSNSKLDQMIEALSASGTAQLAAWLGRDVRAPTKAPWDGAPISVYPPEPPADTVSASLVVLDKDGAIVNEIPFEPGAETVAWNGQKRGGGEAPKGSYAFEVRYSKESGDSTLEPAEVWSRVVEARRQDGKAMLALSNGETVDADEVSGVRVTPETTAPPV